MITRACREQGSLWLERQLRQTRSVCRQLQRFTAFWSTAGKIPNDNLLISGGR